MNDAAMSHEQLVNRLDVLANESLQLWDVPADAGARMINLSENATYLVESPGGHRSVLRVHRESYHTKNAIACELAWMRALHEEGGVITPDTIPGRDGEVIQEGITRGLPAPRYMVMFEFVEGQEPDESQDLVAPFGELGEIAARTHIHSMNWRKPGNFERLVWDVDHIFGEGATWGDWREAPAMDGAAREVLERQEQVITHRLAAYGKGPDRYGLIHADMRLANLLIDGGTTRLIDFDDSGFGWFMYDFAAGVSFMEDHPQVPALRDSWVKGYRSVRDLPEEDEREIDTFIMLRRMALLAWIGSHSETELAQQQGPAFTRVSVELAEKYLAEFDR